MADPSAIPPGSIVAQTADGVQHVFPSGTPESAIDAAIADYTTKQAPGYQAARTAAQEQEGSPAKPNPFADVARGMENGLTFNNADRIEGGLAATGQYLENKVAGSEGRPTPAQAYAATRDVVNEQDSQFSGAHPYASFATNVAGSLANPVVRGAGKVIGGAKSFLGATGRSAVVGAGTGGAYGLFGDKTDPTAGAIAGAVGGGLLGGLMPGGARLASVVTDKVVSPFVNYARTVVNPSAATEIAAATQAKQAASTAQSFAQRYRLTPEGIQDLAAKNPDYQQGAPITTAELIGRNAIGDTRALATRSGDAAETVPPILQQRQHGDAPLDGEVGRFVDNVAESTGIDPRTALADHTAMLDQSRDAVNPAYASIRANPEPVVQSPEMAKLVQSDPKIQQAIATVRANTRTGEMGDQPNAAQWLQVRDLLNRGAAYDEVTGRPPNDLVARAYTEAAKDLTSHLNDAIPGFADATADAARYKAPEQTFKNATGMLFGSGNGKQLSDVHRLMGNLNTADERVAAQRAFMNDIFNKENNGGSMRQMLLPGTRQKLAAVFGDDIAEQIQQAALSRSRLAANANRMNPNANSATAESAARGGEMNEAALDILSKGAEGFFHGGLEGAAKGAGSSFLKRGFAYIGAPQSQAYRDYAIGQLMRPADEFVSNYVPPAASTKSVMIAPALAQAPAQVMGQQPQQ